MIYFNGKSSDDVGIVVERYPMRQLPARKFEAVSVPGRNGDLYFGQGAFANVSQTYDVYLRANVVKVPRAARAVAEWLFAADGYARLEDDYDVDTYREAYFAGPLDIENLMNRNGRATLEFTCKPQRWIKTGQRPRRIYASGGSVNNPTPFPARPLLDIEGTGAGTVTINGVTLQISTMPAGGHMYADCETQNSYIGSVNLNANVTAPQGYPTLAQGENVITWTGAITGLVLRPRTWTL